MIIDILKNFDEKKYIRLDGIKGITKEKIGIMAKKYLELNSIYNNLEIGELINVRNTLTKMKNEYELNNIQ